MSWEQVADYLQWQIHANMASYGAWVGEEWVTVNAWPQPGIGNRVNLRRWQRLGPAQPGRYVKDLLFNVPEGRARALALALRELMATHLLQ